MPKVSSCFAFSEVVASMNHLMRGVPVPGNVAHGVITQVRADWKFQAVSLLSKISPKDLYSGYDMYFLLGLPFHRLALQKVLIASPYWLQSVQNQLSFGKTSKEWFNLAVNYKCNSICHHCRANKNDFMHAPSNLDLLFRHDLRSFQQEALKPGPKSIWESINIRFFLHICFMGVS